MSIQMVNQNIKWLLKILIKKGFKYFQINATDSFGMKFCHSDKWHVMTPYILKITCSGMALGIWLVLTGSPNGCFLNPKNEPIRVNGIEIPSHMLKIQSKVDVYFFKHFSGPNSTQFNLIGKSWKTHPEFFPKFWFSGSLKLHDFSSNTVWLMKS